VRKVGLFSVRGGALRPRQPGAAERPLERRRRCDRRHPRRRREHRALDAGRQPRWVGRGGRSRQGGRGHGRGEHVRRERGGRPRRAIDASTVSSTNSTFSANQAENGGAIHAATGSRSSAHLQRQRGERRRHRARWRRRGRPELDPGRRDGHRMRARSSKLTDQGGNFSTDGSCGLTQATSRTGCHRVPCACPARRQRRPHPDRCAAHRQPGDPRRSRLPDAGDGPARSAAATGRGCDSGAFQVEPPPGYDISFPQCGDLFPVTPRSGSSA